MGTLIRPDDLADMFIEAAEGLAAGGESLTRSNLLRMLAGDPRFTGIQSKTQSVNPSSGQGGSLLSEPDSHILEREEFFRGVLARMADLLGHQKSFDVKNALNAFKEHLLEGSKAEVLENAFKIVMLKVCEGGPSGTGLKSGSHSEKTLAAGLNGPKDLVSQDLLEVLKDLHLEILEGLHLDLDETYLERIGALKESIRTSKDIESFRSLRPELESIIRYYSQQFFEERRNASLFVSEIIEHLEGLEKEMTATADHPRELSKASNRFHASLETDVEQLSKSIREMHSLDDLKHIVLARLDKVRQVLKHKRLEDEARFEEAVRSTEALKVQVQKLRTTVERIESEKKELASKIGKDPLTSTLNRMAFNEHLDDELERFRRYQRTFSIIMMDIDHFKQINDTYGHTMGDRCLKEVVRKAQAVLRRNDLFARYGGEEFAIILPECTQDRGFKVAEKVRQIVDETEFTEGEERFSVTLSLGVTESRKEDKSSEDLIVRADRALYRAKELGRNRVEAC
ncbi:MAG: diguanylate cyclase [Deltaproteobacteria bacterium]|nr:diguanylate cyclase [Deltaproteobacteria bacterium]